MDHVFSGLFVHLFTEARSSSKLDGTLAEVIVEMMSLPSSFIFLKDLIEYILIHTSRKLTSIVGLFQGYLIPEWRLDRDLPICISCYLHSDIYMCLWRSWIARSKQNKEELGCRMQLLLG